MRPTSSTQHRESKKGSIVSFFVAHLGEDFRSSWLHGEFGSAFRTRVSELNGDASCPIVIRNRTDENDESVYWAVPRQAATSILTPDLPQVALSHIRESWQGERNEDAPLSLFGDLTPPQRWRDDG